MRRALVLVALGACYDAPTGPAACTITCTDACPGDLSCKNGYCVAGDEQCAPAFEQISTGGGFACAIDALHDLWCWGSNAHHQIEPSSEVAFPAAHHVGTRKWEAVSAGRAHTCGISEGEMLCWGANEHGQITASIAGDVTTPTPIVFTGAPASWTSVSAGFASTCAIGNDGRLFCWGAGKNGQLGNGSTADIGAPTPVSTMLSDWTTVVQGGGTDYQHTCALSASTGLSCWGSNAYFELSEQSQANQSTPFHVTLDNVTAVAAAAYSTCAISSGDLYCWGYPNNGALGDPTVIDPQLQHTTPTLASSVHGWTALAAAEQMVCGIAGGDVYCWGYSVSGTAFGDGVQRPGQSLFTKVASGADAIAVGVNEYSDDAMTAAYDMDNACFLAAGAIRCWGDDRFGQLAQGASTETAVPLEVAGGHAWMALATGRDHACGVDDAGEVHCWGSTLVGAVDGTIAGTADTPCADQGACDPGKPRQVTAGTALAVGSDHTCVFDVGVVRCWGDDSYLQLGAGSVGPTPVAVTSLSGPFVELYDSHGLQGCAKTALDTQCWGNYTAVGKAPELTGMQTILSSGTIFDDGVGTYKGSGYALDPSGQLRCFGDNSLGQFGNGPVKTTCNNGTCEPGECESCPADCGTCTTCGNTRCDNGETVKTCPADCGGGTTVSALPRSYVALGVGWDLDNRGAPVCGVLATGAVECWGRNARGMITQQLDATGTKIVDYAKAPVPIAGLAGCTQVAVGAAHACAQCGNDILCWGDHRHGAVGSGAQTAMTVTTPRPIDLALSGGETWTELEAGAAYSCARTSQGRALCWGANPHGALGLGASSSTVPIVVRTE